MYFVVNCKVDGMDSSSVSFVIPSYIAGAMGSTERLPCDRYMFV